MKFVVALIFFCVICTEAFAQKCLNADGPVGANSNAKFWKGIAGAEYIAEVTDASHEEFVQGNSTVFVLYYSPGCGYCREVRKPFAGAAKKLTGKVSFGAVDCNKNEICRNHDHPIEGYPTFFLYKDGEWNEEYNSERTTRAFVDYLNEKL